MASSMSSLNVQRGVGTSTNGSASFGASINMQTGNLYQESGAEDKSMYELSFNAKLLNPKTSSMSDINDSISKPILGLPDCLLTHAKSFLTWMLLSFKLLAMTVDEMYL